MVYKQKKKEDKKDKEDKEDTCILLLLRKQSNFIGRNKMIFFNKEFGLKITLNNVFFYDEYDIMQDL